MNTPNAFALPHMWVDRPVPVTLAGVGGTGGEMLDGLLRLHMALRKLGHPGLHVTAFDPDEVSPANIGRQRFYPGDEGQNKAVLSIHRINMFNGLNWKAVPDFFDIESSIPPYRPDNLLVTCLDSASARAEIGKRDGRLGPTLWLDTGNDESTGQVVFGTLGTYDTKLPHVYDLYPEVADQPDDDAPSCSFEEAIASQDLMINRLVADAGIDLLWTLLRKGSIKHHGAFVEASPMHVAPLPIDPMVWASLGWTANNNAQAA